MTVKTARLINYDGVVAPLIPATVNVDAGILTATPTISGGSSPNQLQLTAVAGALRYQDTASALAADGNHNVVATMRGSGGNARILGCVFDASVTPRGTGGASGTYYGAFVDSTAGAILIRYLVGVDVTLGSVGTTVQGVTYVLDYTRQFDANGNGWIYFQVQRLSDNQYIQADGTWGVGREDCLRVCENSIAAGAGAKVAGTLFYAVSALDALGYDDFQPNDAYPCGFHAWGDSITASLLASNGGWVEYLRGQLLTGIQNHGIGGMQAVDCTAAMLSSVAFNANTVALLPSPSFGFIGTNDQIDAAYGADATKQGYFDKTVRSGIAWQCLPTKTLAKDATKTGVWTDNPTLYGAAMDRFCATIGNKLTFTGIVGSTIFVWYTALDSASAGTFKVTVDGVDVVGATADCSAIGLTTVAYTGKPARASGSFLLVVTGQTSGSHTVDLEVTSANNVFLDAVAGIGNNSAQNTVIWGDIPNMGAAGYATFGGNLARTAVYCGIVSTAITSLQGNGLNCFLARVNAAINAATQTTPDGVHLTNGGQVSGGGAFLDADLPGAPTIGVAVATGPTTATVSFTAGTVGAGGATTLYTAVPSSGSGTGTLAQSGSGTINVTGLTTGVAVTFTVVPTNPAGNGPASAASNSVTPTAPSSSGSGGPLFRGRNRHRR